MLPFREAGAAPPAVPGPPKARDLASWILSRPGQPRRRRESEARRRPGNAARTWTPSPGTSPSSPRSSPACHGDRLDDWITAVEADDQPDLHSFIRGIKRDYDAVLNGLTMPWSSGVVEGNVNRLKMLKRQMYGRAAFPLLRKRVLLVT